MDCAEMACDISQRLVIYNAHEFDRETSLGCLRGGDLTGVLTSSQQHMEFLEVLAVEEGTYRSCTAGLYELEDSHWCEGLWVQELGLTISRASDQHGVIISHSEGKDLTLVDFCLLHNLVVLPVMDEEATLVSRDVQGLIEGTP